MRLGTPRSKSLLLPSPHDGSHAPESKMVSGRKLSVHVNYTPQLFMSSMSSNLVEIRVHLRLFFVSLLCFVGAHGTLPGRFSHTLAHLSIAWGRKAAPVSQGTLSVRF